MSPQRFRKGQIIQWTEGGNPVHIASGTVVALLRNGDAVVQRSGSEAAEVLQSGRPGITVANSKTFSLKNGMSLLHYEDGFVIADTGKERYERFATWRAEPDPDEITELHTFSGHYFVSIIDAVEDFYVRTGQERP